MSANTILVLVITTMFLFLLTGRAAIWFFLGFLFGYSVVRLIKAFRD